MGIFFSLIYDENTFFTLHIIFFNYPYIIFTNTYIQVNKSTTTS
jgi:hypothetical protein